MIKRSNTDSLLSKIRICDQARKALAVVKGVAACFSEPSSYRSAEQYPDGKKRVLHAEANRLLQTLWRLRVSAVAFRVLLYIVVQPASKTAAHRASCHLQPLTQAESTKHPQRLTPSTRERDAAGKS